MAAGDERPSLRDPRSSGSIKSSLARAVHQHRGFLELARIVAAGEGGIWTGALPAVLGPAGASWGAAYRVTAGSLELAASEGVPMSLRSHIASIELGRHPAFAACRALRSRRSVTDERLFTTIVDPRVSAQLDAAGITVGVAVPIVHGGTVFGILLAGTTSREPVEAEALTFLEAVATLIAPAIGFAEIAKTPSSDQRRSSSHPRLTAAAASAARKPVDAGRVTLDAVQQIGAVLRRLGADVRTSIEEGCQVLGDPNELRLAVAHLLTNAAEAAAERAPMSGAPTQPRKVRVSLAREGTAVALGIEDSGRGVPPDLRSRVFDTGFSTKAKGRGNGLSQVRQIALDHGGHVEIAASELGGALFRLVLPTTAARPDQQGASTLPHNATVPQMRAARTQRSKSDPPADGDDGEAEPRRIRHAAC